MTRPGPARGLLAPIGRTLGLARPVAGRIALAVVLGSGAIVAAIGLLAAAAWLLSRAAGHPPEAALTVGIVLVQLFGLSRGPLRYGERLVGHDAAFRLLARIRVRLYGHLERLTPAGLPLFRSGDLLARLVADVDSLQDLVVRVVPAFAIAALVGVVTVGALYALLPSAGLVVGAALVLSAVPVPWLTGTLARRREASQAQLRGDLAASVVDLVEGADELAVFGATAAQLDRIASLDRQLGRVARSSAATAGVGLGLITLLTGLATWGVLVVGVPAVHARHLDPLWLASIALVPSAAFEAVATLPAAAQALHRSRGAAARLFGVVDAPDIIREPDSTGAAPSPPLPIEARSVGAHFPADPRPVLRGVDLRAPRGGSVAVVGPSGSGKSTLAWVLVGFLPADAGVVTLDGIPLDRLRAEDLRALVGLVSQDSHLFAASLAENLRLGRHDASAAELRAVLDQVGLGPWVAGLPEGLATDVGRFGVRLSGGQRQRVAVARALLASFAVLVLDEPVEHLDAAGADDLVRELIAPTDGRTTVLISHRLAGLDRAGEIVVLEGGRVVEAGAHGQLVALGGTYARLEAAQAEADRVGAEGRGS